MSQPSRPEKGSVTLYFLGTEDTKYIKIGKTTQSVAARRTQHESGGPTDRRLTFLASVLGSDVDERTLHRAFSGSRSRTEWFHATPDLEGYVRWLRLQYFAAQTEDACMERVASDMWLPSAGRTAQPPDELPFDTWGHVLIEHPITGDDYYTNPTILDAARYVCGEFDLDPASHPEANRHVRALRIYTIADNGLTQPWEGRVWCNPPFAQWDAWSEKIRAELARGRVSDLFLLMPTRSLSTRPNAALLDMTDGLCITRGRIPFLGPKATPSPDDGHAVLYFGERLAAFAKSFASVGPSFTNPARNPT
jgi:hypothetical protein